MVFLAESTVGLLDLPVRGASVEVEELVVVFGAEGEEGQGKEEEKLKRNG